MPVFDITAPDGTKYRVTGPEGATEQDALKQVQQQMPSAPAGDPATSGTGTVAPASMIGMDERRQPSGWADVPMAALENAVPSAIQFGKDLAQPFIHPIETAENLYKVGSGVAQKVGLQSGQQNVPYADAVGKFFADRYGGMENLKRTIATDPVGFASDVATVLTGGGALAKAGRLTKVGEGVAKAGRAVDPFSLVPLAGKGAAQGLGMTTMVGPKPIEQAFEAGRAGGQAGQRLQENLRGTVPPAEAVQAARQGLQKMVSDRGDAYRAKMAEIGANTTPLTFDKIDSAIDKAGAIKTYKGRDLSPSTSAVRQQMTDAINEWRALDPREFHTAEGLDKLKQMLGDIRDSTDPGKPERNAANAIYHAVRQTIIDEVPQYAPVMKAYEEASKFIKQMEKTLSLNENAAIDTSLRKLQSVLRDNVNTSYGHRADLAQYLVKAGAPHLMERLAGQALQPWAPRGLGKLLGGEILALKAFAMVPALSPRLTGEAAYYTGKVAGKIPAARAQAQTAFQIGRIGNQLDPREMVRQEARAALRSKPEGKYSASQIRAIRDVARGSAPVDTVLTVKRMLETSYGGPQ